MTNVRKGPVLGIILVSCFMIVLDVSIVIPALPKIQAASASRPLRSPSAR